MSSQQGYRPSKSIVLGAAGMVAMAVIFALLHDEPITMTEAVGVTMAILVGVATIVKIDMIYQ